MEEELDEDSLDRESKLLEGLQSKKDQYIYFVRGEQRHPGDCSAMPGRCYICRGEGH